MQFSCGSLFLFLFAPLLLSFSFVPLPGETFEKIRSPIPGISDRPGRGPSLSLTVCFLFQPQSSNQVEREASKGMPHAPGSVLKRVSSAKVQPRSQTGASSV